MFNIFITILISVCIAILFLRLITSKVIKYAECQKIASIFAYIVFGAVGIIMIAYLVSSILYPLFNLI